MLYYYTRHMVARLLSLLYLQPRVDLDGADAVVQRLVHLAEVAVVEEERQQAERVLYCQCWVNF